MVWLVTTARISFVNSKNRKGDNRPEAPGSQRLTQWRGRNLETRREGPPARLAALSLPFEDCAWQRQQCQAGSIRLSLEVSFVGPTVLSFYGISAGTG